MVMGTRRLTQTHFVYICENIHACMRIYIYIYIYVCIYILFIDRIINNHKICICMLIYYKVEIDTYCISRCDQQSDKMRPRGSVSSASLDFEFSHPRPLSPAVISAETSDDDSGERKAIVVASIMNAPPKEQEYTKYTNI